MKTVVFAPSAIQQLQQFKSGNQKLVFKIFELIENIQQTPFTGIGKPEALKGNLFGFWSRRINHEHRLVYQVSNEHIYIYSCLSHYAE
jgi:toxin YoeB